MSPILAAESMASSLSPVSGHTLFWILFSLAINSMAQPSSGRLCGLLKGGSRLRIYLCSSPFVCLCDALNIIIRLIILMTRLKISPRKACRLVVLGRSDFAFKEGEPSILHVKDSPASTIQIQSHRWPRWLFFIIGTLPAAIKLASFSGTPWTKTWGMMFAISFVVIELVYAVARSRGDDSEHVSSVSTILGFSETEWEDPQNEVLHSKISSATQAIGTSNVFLIMIVFFVNVGILVWAAGSLWVLVIYNSKVLNILSLVKFIVSLFVLPLMIGGWILSWMRVSLYGKRLGWLQNVSFCLIAVLPSKLGKTKWTNQITWLSVIVSVVYLTYGFFWICHKLMVRVCKRWPGVGRALLFDNMALSREGEELGEDTDPSVPEEPFVSNDEEPIDELAWQGFCLFIINVVVCALWYTILYDPTGTVNPSWTEVFG